MKPGDLVKIHMMTCERIIYPLSNSHPLARSKCDCTEIGYVLSRDAWCDAGYPQTHLEILPSTGGVIWVQSVYAELVEDSPILNGDEEIKENE